MKKMRMILPFMASLFLIVSCSKSDSDAGNPNPTPATCTGPAKSFSSDVNPLIQTFCNKAGCHATGSTNGPGPLTNYSQVFTARGLIRSAVSTGLMPQDATLTTAQKNAIICWIESGAPDN